MERHYLENMSILITRLYDRHGGAIEVTDFAPRFGYQLIYVYRSG